MGDTIDHTLEPENEGVISEDNTTFTPLNNGQVFTGDFIEATIYASFTVMVDTDTDPGADALLLQASMDGVNITTSKPITLRELSAGNWFSVNSLTIAARFYRVKFTNSGTNETYLRLQMILQKSKNRSLSVSMSQRVTNSDDVALTRSVTMGQNPAGNYINSPVDSEGHPLIRIQGPISAFGEMLTASMTPEVQLQFPYNINSDLVNTTLVASGTVTQGDSMAILQTGASSSSSAEMDSVRFIKYRSGQGVSVRFTALFTLGVTNSTQVIGIGDSNDGFFFAYNGVDFGIIRRAAGTDNHILQTAWNIDKMNGLNGDDNPSNVLLDQTKGNVFEIQFQWLGFGQIQFSLENPSTGTFTPVHRIKYANANIVPSVINPSFPLFAKVENTTNATNIMMKTGSMAGFIEGIRAITGPTNSVNSSKTISSTVTNVLTIRNKTTYQSKQNRIRIFLSIISASSDGTKSVKIELIQDADVAGTPVFNDVNTANSVIEFDVAGTGITNGKPLAPFGLAKVDSQTTIIKELELALPPGGTMTVAASSPSSNDVEVGLVWVEDF